MMGIIAAGVSTGSFAFVLIAVDPATVHTFIQQSDIRFAQGSQTSADNGHCLIKRNIGMLT